MSKQSLVQNDDFDQCMVIFSVKVTMETAFGWQVISMAVSFTPSLAKERAIYKLMFNGM